MMHRMQQHTHDAQAQTEGQGQGNEHEHGRRHGRRHGHEHRHERFGMRGPRGPFGPQGPHDAQEAQGGPPGPGLGMRGGPRGGFPFGGRFGGPFGGGGFGGPGFGGGRGRRTGRGDVRLAALSLLAEGPMHGYQLIQEIAERSGGEWKPSPGSVYPMLQQLADEGLVRAEEAEGRRVFTLTEAGQTYVNERRAEIAAVWESATGGGDDAVRELWQGFGQVAAAMQQVSHAGTPAQIAAAGRLIAETRRQLYRILAGDAPTGTPTGDTPAPDDATAV